MRDPAQLRAVIHFFFNDTATTEIYTLSLHDALPISVIRKQALIINLPGQPKSIRETLQGLISARSEEHTSELQSRPHLVCRLLLQKKKQKSFGPSLRFTGR